MCVIELKSFLEPGKGLSPELHISVPGSGVFLEQIQAAGCGASKLDGHGRLLKIIGLRLNSTVFNMTGNKN
jgi:hypothetical protein